MLFTLSRLEKVLHNRLLVCGKYTQMYITLLCYITLRILDIVFSTTKNTNALLNDKYPDKIHLVGYYDTSLILILLESIRTVESKKAHIPCSSYFIENA